MTSAAYNRGSSLAVDLGPIQRPDAHSYVLCHQIKSFDWKARSARPHPFSRLEADKLEQVMSRLTDKARRERWRRWQGWHRR